MPFLFGCPLLVVFWYWLIMSSAWNSVLGLGVLSALLIAGLPLFNRHAGYARLAFFVAAFASGGIGFAVLLAEPPGNGAASSAHAVLALGFGVVFALVARAVSREDAAAESAMLRFAEAASGDLVCPRCHDTGTYWTSVNKPCPLHHRPGVACWACNDTGTVQQKEPIPCVHLRIELPA